MMYKENIECNWGKVKCVYISTRRNHDQLEEWSKQLETFTNYLCVSLSLRANYAGTPCVFVWAGDECVCVVKDVKKLKIAAIVLRDREGCVCVICAS